MLAGPDNVPRVANELASSEGLGDGNGFRKAWQALGGEVILELEHDAPREAASDADAGELGLQTVGVAHASTASTAPENRSHWRRRASSARRPFRVSR